MTTDMGHGVDFMSGTHEWHGKAPNDDQLEVALGQLEETLRGLLEERVVCSLA